ncbi:MAG: hypothetical protein V4617_05305 [Gemmatimonadota bacterium]
MMSRSVPVLLLLALAACSDHTIPTASPAPGLEPSLSRSAGADDARADHARAGGRYLVAMLDNCDAVSWVNLGGCTINGTVTVPAFQAAVASLGGHPDWRNDPVVMDVKWNAKLLVTNLGGRDHTFTRVAAFGGGYVAPLNNPARIPDTGRIAPECNPALVDIVSPGEETEVRVDHGTRVKNHDERYQCCIHPWMRTTVQVRHDAPR